MQEIGKGTKWNSWDQAEKARRSSRIGDVEHPQAPFSTSLTTILAAHTIAITFAA